jgi:hypothetical protein
MATIANSVAITCCNAQVDSVDAGTIAAAGSLLVYSGTAPARPDASLGAAVLLATHLLSNPAFGAAADSPGDNWAEAALNAVGDDVSIDADGTASFARFVDRDGTPKLQVSVTATGGGGELTFNTVDFQLGALATITGGEWRQPEGTHP